MEIGSRRETVSDHLDPFWTGSADNQLPTKTADLALGTRGIPRCRRGVGSCWHRWQALGTKIAESIARRRKTQGGLDGLLTRKKTTPTGFENWAPS